MFGFDCLFFFFIISKLELFLFIEPLFIFYKAFVSITSVILPLHIVYGQMIISNNL